MFFQTFMILPLCMYIFRQILFLKCFNSYYYSQYIRCKIFSVSFFIHLGWLLHLLCKRLYTIQYHQSYFKYLGIIQGFCKSFPTWGLLLINSCNVDFRPNFWQTLGKLVIRGHFYITSKLYIPSTLNIDLILWHTQLNVCA